jgi:hypothetical protein
LRGKRLRSGCRCDYDGDCDCDYDCDYGMKHAQGMRSDTHTRNVERVENAHSREAEPTSRASFNVVGNVPVGVLTVERPEAVEQR